MANKPNLPSRIEVSRDQPSQLSRELQTRLEAFLSLRSTNTQTTYRGIISEWITFLGPHTDPDSGAKRFLAATDIDAARYKLWLEKRPGQKARLDLSESDERAVSTQRMKRTKNDGVKSTQANATIAKKFTALRRIYKMLIGAGMLALNPFDTDRVPPPPKDSGQKRPTEMVDFALVKDILELPDKSTAKGRRDRALLGLLFGAGLRRSEVAALRIGDVRTSQQGTCYIKLRATKAKRDADQALPAWAAERLQATLADRAKHGAKSGDHVFIGYSGRSTTAPSSPRLSDDGLYKIFKHYCLAAGAGGYLSPHSARATAITKLLSDGIPHRLVQEFSRHSSIQMVEAYDKRRLGVEENPGKELKY